MDETGEIIYAKKMLFARTILVRDEHCIYNLIFKIRAIKFNEDIIKGIENVYDSTVFDILRIAILHGMYDEVMNSHMYTQSIWNLRYGHAHGR